MCAVDPAGALIRSPMDARYTDGRRFIVNCMQLHVNTSQKSPRRFPRTAYGKNGQLDEAKVSSCLFAIR